MEQPPNLGPPAIELVYQGTSDQRPLEEFRLHSGPSNYETSKNLLASPLQREQRVVIEGFTPGSYYLTVMRKDISHDTLSKIIAITTASSVNLASGRFEIWVFDESFRVYDPVKNN